jgi:hypothetical protein
MLMMFVMMGGMMVMTTKAATTEAKKQAEAMREKESKVNPYKEAKKTGKSVEAIVEQDQKDKAKAAAKAAKKAAKEAEEEYNFDFDDFDFEEEGVYKVKAPRPIAAGGSAYITGRKAEAEKRAAELAARKEQEAKWAANAKRGKGKKKK